MTCAYSVGQCYVTSGVFNSWPYGLLEWKQSRFTPMLPLRYTLASKKYPNVRPTEYGYAYKNNYENFKAIVDIEVNEKKRISCIAAKVIVRFTFKWYPTWYHLLQASVQLVLWNVRWRKNWRISKPIKFHLSSKE